MKLSAKFYLGWLTTFARLLPRTLRQVSSSGDNPLQRVNFPQILNLGVVTLISRCNQLTVKLCPNSTLATVEKFKVQSIRGGWYLSQQPQYSVVSGRPEPEPHVVWWTVQSRRGGWYLSQQPEYTIVSGRPEPEPHVVWWTFPRVSHSWCRTPYTPVRYIWRIIQQEYPKRTFPML